MDYDYIKVGSDLLRISRGEWRGLERSKRLSPRDPWRETTSSQKNGWAANRATHGALSVISPFTSPSRGAQRALIDCVLNYVFTCVPDKLPWAEIALKSRARYAIEHRASKLPLIVARIVSLVRLCFGFDRRVSSTAPSASSATNVVRSSVEERSVLFASRRMYVISYLKIQ